MFISSELHLMIRQQLQLLFCFFFTILLLFWCHLQSIIYAATFTFKNCDMPNTIFFLHLKLFVFLKWCVQVRIKDKHLVYNLAEECMNYQHAVSKHNNASCKMSSAATFRDRMSAQLDLSSVARHLCRNNLLTLQMTPFLFRRLHDWEQVQSRLKQARGQEGSKKQFREGKQLPGYRSHCYHF